MDIHVCKQCGLRFAYCKACVFKPIYYKDLGFCSKECYTESKKEVIPVEDVEVVMTEKDTSTLTENATEYPYFFTEVEIKRKKKRLKNVDETLKENDINENEQNNGSAI